MRLAALVLLFACHLIPKDKSLVKADAEIPTQTFFIPLPEKDVFDITFKRINTGARGPVNSIIAISVSTPNTIIWYDHHEDGFELGYRNASALSKTTEVWGDGNCENGFAFGTTCRSPADDVLKAGQSIVIENIIDISANANNGIKYDGGDKVLATYPIAITRGAYPLTPGSLMAGAVEILETSEWGTFFIAPAGQDVPTSAGSFEHTSMYVMAKDDGTTINFSDGTNYTLNCGESVTHIIPTMGQTLTSSAPVQVDFIAGDVQSLYELRWYSLLPRNDWTNAYFSPVGDTTGTNKIYLYNPNSFNLTVTVKHSEEFNTKRTQQCTPRPGTTPRCVLVTNRIPIYPLPYNVNVPGQSFAFTNVIPSGTGAELTASGNFLALSMTDTETGGNVYDWGFPVLPSNKLTEKVLIGWGYGCTNKDCSLPNDVGGLARSVVWVSPWETADIYVDIDNDGIPEANRTMKNVMRLSSKIIENGNDISGATIWAVKPGEPHDSLASVRIAAAWGQNADWSYDHQPLSLDLGTLVPPFIGVRVNEVVDLVEDKDGDGKISPGDDVEYTIQVQNAGQRDYGPCDYKIKDPGLPGNLPFQKYVDGTCVFIYQDQQQSCNDASLNGGDGLCSPATLPKRGGVHLYKFRATVGSPAELNEVDISNKGVLTQTGLGPILPFSAPEVVHFRPSVNIEKTVHLGTLTTCSNGEEIVKGRQDDIVTYCFNVTNTGNTYLDNVTVTDPDNGMLPITTIPFMAPGDVTFVKFETKIPPTSITTNATVTAEPRLVNKKVISTYEGGPVNDTDPAGVDSLAYQPGLSIKKYGGPQGSSCNLDKMSDDTYLAEDTKFEYCYVITNTGDECLVNITLTDNAIGGRGNQSIPDLCPGDSAVKVTGPATTTLADVPSTDATVSGKGKISGSDVSAKDPVAIDIPVFEPKLSIKKYAGPPGSSCSVDKMKDDTHLAEDTRFEYCYIINNIGNECLVNVTVKDTALGGLGTQSFPKLCPGDTAVNMTGQTTTSLVSIPSTDATVTGKGELSSVEATAKDPVAVEVPVFEPKLSVKKYAGPPGSSCNIDKMKDDTYLAEDTKFEYCYVIDNVGNECVTNITVRDNAVGGIGTQSIPKLCPSDSPVTISGQTNTSKVDIPPTDATVTGKGEYSGSETSASDPVGVDIPDFAPMVSVKKYAGPQGSSCNIASMKDDIFLAEDRKFEYCYVISNTGNECVVDMVLTDESIGGIGSLSIAKICPGDNPYTTTGPASTTIVDVPSTDATVTGKGEYSDIEVNVKDPASVDIPAYVPGLSVKKYAGPPDSSCNIDNMEDDTFVTRERGFEYCYVVNNTGNECIVGVTLIDNAVGGIGSYAVAKICPGDAPLLINGTSSSSETRSNVPSTEATVTGTGEYSNSDVTVTDPASVEFLEPLVPGINIEKTVHLGEIPECFNGRELEYGFSGTVVTYCYEVTNTGNVPLDVVVTDGPVGLSESFPLPVGSSVFVKKVSSITGSLESPGIAGGTSKEGGDKVEDTDTAGVELVPEKQVCV